MNRTIRRATADDIDGVQRAIARSWRHGYEGVMAEETLTELTASPAEFYPEERFREKLADDDLCYLVAVADGEIAGIVNVCWGEHNTHEFVAPDGGEVRSLYLDPAFWRAGLGTALFETGLDHLPNAVETLFVEVLAANERGQSFYESVGFSRFDDRTISLYGETLETELYRQRRRC